MGTGTYRLVTQIADATDSELYVDGFAETLT